MIGGHNHAIRVPDNACASDTCGITRTTDMTCSTNAANSFDSDCKLPNAMLPSSCALLLNVPAMLAD
jgi:hypothetical protein